MNLSYHVDWPAAEAHLRAFWAGEPLRRPPIHLTVSKPEAERAELPRPRTAAQKFFDKDFLLRYAEASLGNRWHVAEALPTCTAGMMAGWLPVYGGRITADWDTVWIHKSIQSWDDTPDWEHDWDDAGWRKLRDAVEYLVDAAAGRFFVGLPPMLPPNDLLSVLREPNAFLMDLVDAPELVLEALGHMTANLLRMHEELCSIIHAQFEGIHHHYPVWCPDSLITMQSDVSCMLSPPMFEEFIVPELEQMSQTAGRAIYHLDGPGAIKHLDRVLDLYHLRMLQWVPGAGQPGGFEHWMRIFKRAQEKGKMIYLPCAPSQLETAIREFRPELTFLLLGEVGGFEEADELLANAEKWTAQYW